MKAEDYGRDLKTGEHSREFTEAEQDMLDILSNHFGKAERISASDLALEFHEARRAGA